MSTPDTGNQTTQPTGRFKRSSRGGTRVDTSRDNSSASEPEDNAGEIQNSEDNTTPATPVITRPTSNTITRTDPNAGNGGKTPRTYRPTAAEISEREEDADQTEESPALKRRILTRKLHITNVKKEE